MMKHLIIPFLVTFLIGCASPPPSSPLVTDTYSLEFHAKNGLNSWSKTLNKGLCKLEVGLSIEKAYTESAKALASKPEVRIVLRDEAKQQEFALAAEYDPESSKVLLFLAHETVGGEYLDHSVRLGEALHLGFIPQPQGDINLEFNKASPLQTIASEQEGEVHKQALSGKVISQIYHAFPDFNIQTVSMQGIGVDVVFDRIVIETGCQ